MDLSKDEIGVLTGEDPDELRDEVWTKRVVCATPQVTVSDMQKKRCKLEEFSIVVFDEVHRAVGNHAYTVIASVYNEFRRDGRILGMTASLPSDKSRIDEIVSKLKIAKVEVRDEKDEDVSPYVYKTEVEWKELELSQTLKGIQSLTRDALNARLKLLEDASLIKRNNYGSITLKDLLRLRMKVAQIQSSQLRNALFSCIRLFHALNLVETQSLSSYKKFMDRMLDRKRGYGMSELLNDQRVKDAYEHARAALMVGEEHPKIAETLKLVEGVKRGERAIVFASYRDTVDQIYSRAQKPRFQGGLSHRKEREERADPKGADTSARRVEGRCLRHSRGNTGWRRRPGCRRVQCCNFLRQRPQRRQICATQGENGQEKRRTPLRFDNKGNKGRSLLLAQQKESRRCKKDRVNFSR